ncbi:MAG TPA: molybdopterin cofactor-binding domain-containing protein [Vicinamibacterales bacterium]|nr:molybdopterin cofactor-binding domain-containing protein [Vicinamibacterales bacterium]
MIDDELEVERYELSESRRYVFALERRTFIKLFGGGLAVMVASDALAQQESGRARPQGRADVPQVAAWIHIDEAGRVRVCTGKTEIGQNIRTSLAQTVADELRVPLAAIEMVMADTSRVPFDQGTFGSLSTPRMAPQLARAAATARELLIDQAAARLQLDRSLLNARDGRVVAPDGRTLAYADVTKGQALAGTIPAAPPIEPRAKWNVRGTPVKKVNGADFVTGRHQFTPDMTRPGMLYGRVVRPDGYGGTVAAIDDARARAMPGVTVIRDGEFIGVVAPNERAAARAAGAVAVTWKVPDGQPSSETIYDYLKTQVERSVPAAVETLAMPQGARVFAATYRVPYIAHVPLEPRAAVAEWQGESLTVWTGTQRPFGVRTELAEAFRIPEARVRVIVPDTGSAYGGKHTGEAAIEAARLAKAAGAPVKLVWTRGEEFSWAYFRPAGVIDIKSAVGADGRILAWAFDNWNSGNAGIQTPYDIASKSIVFHPSRTPLRQGSYRALAATANHYAREMHMDEMARALGIDPLDFRLRHLNDERMRAVLTAVAVRIGWRRRAASGSVLIPREERDAAARGRALGIACGTEKGGYVATAADVSRLGDGFKVDRLVVAFECGAIVNPDGLLHQVEGAVVQALGGALFEAVDFADGRLRNGSMEQYRVPRFKDVPRIETLLIDRPDLPSAGAGEAPLIAVAPAIGSAVRAFGRVDTALPVRLLT